MGGIIWGMLPCCRYPRGSFFGLAAACHLIQILLGKNRLKGGQASLYRWNVLHLP
jgi:hypothetical protein